MNRSRLSWYARRLAKMSPVEVAWRAHDAAQHRRFARHQVRALDEAPLPRLLTGARTFGPALPPGAAVLQGDDARAALRHTVAALLEGKGEVLGSPRTDLRAPDWFLDPVTGRRAPSSAYAFAVDHRDEAVTGNVKQIWELSRLHHLTQLAAAYQADGDHRCAEVVAAQLSSWWRANPPLSGVNWTSGIEIGIRLISFAWIRRLLDGWPRAAALFEENGDALRQIWWHQRYLATFRSRGSSANNHVIAEAAGQLVGALAFPWFAESERWQADAVELLERSMLDNTFPSGINREQASGYQWFVAELGLVAAAEAAAHGRPLSLPARRCLAAMVDSAIALLDETGRPPRQGDGDDGRALVLDGDGPTHPECVTALAAGLLGPAPWWPRRNVGASIEGTLLGALAGDRMRVAARPAERPSHFADAGLTLIRSDPELSPEIWCRCDGGPHGFGAMAAHAHADALSIEVRHGGVDVLADPGTYCYHGEPEFRSYFRSTIGHNTLEIGGTDQSVSGGPFLWVRAARSQLTYLELDEHRAVGWGAAHDGYMRLESRVRHERRVRLDGVGRFLAVTDLLDAGEPADVRMAFHLGPALDCELDGTVARAVWDEDGVSGSVRLELAEELDWHTHRGESESVAGWYSGGFGRREAATVLIGSGRLRPGRSRLETLVTFSP